jgi:hypothetical protein
MARNIPTLKARARFRERLLFGLTLAKPLRLFCDHCDKFVPSDLKWRCSHCNGENTRTWRNSFLNKCEHCKRSPKSYECPHCQKINFLDRDSDAGHPARQSVAPDPSLADFDYRAFKRELHGDKVEDLRHEIDVERLNLELASLKAARTEPLNDPRARLEKSFSEHDAHMMAVHEIARRERQRNAEKYRDDPELREMADDSVQMWVERNC